MLDLKQQRVLVTGGHGFLGRHVCAKLADMGVEMWAPSHDEVCLGVEGETAKILEYSPGVVIHLAAHCGGIGANAADPGGMFRENIEMGTDLIHLCGLYQINLVLLGTVCSYPKHCPVPFKESDLWNGYPEETNAPYGIAKRALFEMARAYHQQYGLKCACLLPANLYGPGDNFDLETSHVIPAMIRKFVEAKESGSPEIPLWGNGLASREFLFVEDAAEAIVKAAEVVDDPNPVNLGTGREIRIDELACFIQRATDHRLAWFRWQDEKPNGQPRRCLDTSRAKQLLKWEAKTSLEDGLRKTIGWYLEHRKELVTA